jgi:FMN reductase
MKFALIYGTAAPAGRLSRALEAFGNALTTGREATLAIIDLSRTSLPFADGTPADSLPSEARAVIETVSACNAVALFAPVYRASAPGALKNLLDLLPVDALEGKPVAVVSMGSTPHHFLANDANLHPILGWFGALQIPGIYLTARSYENGALTPEAREHLEVYAASLADTAGRLAGMAFRPRPLAATARG